MDSQIEEENDIWFWYDSRWNINQYSNAKFKRFVLNKTCPKCGSKIYWLRGKDKLLCPNCETQLTINQQTAKNSINEATVI